MNYYLFIYKVSPLFSKKIETCYLNNSKKCKPVVLINSIIHGNSICGSSKGAFLDDCIVSGYLFTINRSTIQTTVFWTSQEKSAVPHIFCSGILKLGHFKLCFLATIIFPEVNRSNQWCLHYFVEFAQLLIRGRRIILPLIGWRIGIPLLFL